MGANPPYRRTNHTIIYTLNLVSRHKKHIVMFGINVAFDITSHLSFYSVPLDWLPSSKNKLSSATYNCNQRYKQSTLFKSIWPLPHYCIVHRSQIFNLLRCQLCNNQYVYAKRDISSGSALFTKTKLIFRERNTIVFEVITHALSIYTIDHLNFIVCSFMNHCIGLHS